MWKKYKFLRFLLSLFHDYGLRPRIYLVIRILLIPQNVFDTIEATSKGHHSLIDIGCWFGIISLYLKYIGYEGIIFGLDIDENRIALLQAICQKHWRTNMTFETRDFIQQWFKGLEGYELGIMIDILHHLDEKTQTTLIAHLWSGIPNVLVKDIDTKPQRKYCRNYFHDRYVMRNRILCFLWSPAIQRLFEKQGYNTIRSFPSSLFPYPHYLLYCTKH